MRLLRHLYVHRVSHNICTYVWYEAPSTCAVPEEINDCFDCPNNITHLAEFVEFVEVVYDEI